jgi:glycosyltransferase 2 family protein
VKHHAAATIKGLLKYGIGFGLLALVIARYWDDDPNTGAPGLRTLLQGPIDYGALAFAACLVAIALSLQLFRWFILIRSLDLPFSLRNTFRLGMVGVFYNTFLPGSVGGDLLKAYFIAKEHPERKARAIATVIADRALGLFGLILFVAALGSLAWAGGDARIIATPGLQWLIKLMAAIAGGTILGFLALGYLPERRVERFARRLKWFPKVGKSLAEFWYTLVTYRQRMRAVALCVGLSALSHFALVFAFHSASRVFPPANPAVEQATLAEHMVVAPIGFIVQALPISPGGVGVGEAAFAGLYKLSGRPQSRGVISRLSLRVVEWIIGLIGYLVYLRMKKELPVVDEENGEAPPPEVEKAGTGGSGVGAV